MFVCRTRTFQIYRFMWQNSFYMQICRICMHPSRNSKIHPMGLHNDKLDYVLLSYATIAYSNLIYRAPTHIPGKVYCHEFVFCESVVVLIGKLYTNGKCMLPESKFISISVNMYLLLYAPTYLLNTCAGQKIYCMRMCTVQLARILVSFCLLYIYIYI